MLKFLLSIFTFFIFIFSCTPINLPTQSEQIEKSSTKTEKVNQSQKKTNLKNINNIISEDQTSIEQDKKISRNITVLFSNKNKDMFAEQFINVLQLGVYNKNLKKVSFEIVFFEDENELKSTIEQSIEDGKIFIGLKENRHTKIAKEYCNEKIIFFTFSNDIEIADECIYLLNFFPKNELTQLFKYLDNESKVAVLYPENNYGYKINLLIDEIVNKSGAVLVNRSSYKNDLSNVRDAIKELGKYELRKYELERQKKILIKKNDEESKKRLKKLNKFKTTKDYDFTHILMADYGLNLLQVAPLLPYYDIDPNIIQFMSTGVIDDENFFFEPSLQGTIFPGVERKKRNNLLIQYEEIYDENLLRISTLPYDLVGLLNYIFSKDLSFDNSLKLLNNENIKFDGVDGEFYFKKNMIERDLDILKISNGLAVKIN